MIMGKAKKYHNINLRFLRVYAGGLSYVIAKKFFWGEGRGPRTKMKNWSENFLCSQIFRLQRHFFRCGDTENR